MVIAVCLIVGLCSSLWVDYWFWVLLAVSCLAVSCLVTDLFAGFYCLRLALSWVLYL